LFAIELASDESLNKVVNVFLPAETSDKSY